MDAALIHIEQRLVNTTDFHFFCYVQEKFFLYRNLTAVKFTAIKKWGYEKNLRKGIGDAKVARNAAASL